MSKQDSTWLITGGCGFIGLNLVRLLGGKYKLRLLDDLSVGPHRPEAELVEGDIRDPAVVAKAMEGVDTVIHLAANTGVIPSIENPRRDFEINGGGTLNLLLAARDASVRKFVYASSNAVLGKAPRLLDETMLPRPLSPYGASKLAGEALCHAFSGSFGLPTLSLRFTNCYGPGALHKGSVIPTFLKLALKGEPLVIYGDGSATRDYIFVDDLCNGAILAAESDVDGEVIQIATGVETTVNRVASLIQEAAGRPLEIVHKPARRGEVESVCASIDKARALLSFEPRVPINEGIATTYRWFSENMRSSMIEKAPTC